MENAVILREWYDRVDSEKTGNITAAQLKCALAVGNLDFPLSVVQQMIRMYDFDKNGTMSFQEFVELNKFLLKVQHAFSDLEKGRGYLVPDDVYKVVSEMLFTLFLDEEIIKSLQGIIFSRMPIILHEAEFFILLYFVLLSFFFLDSHCRIVLLQALVKIGFSLDSPAFYTVCESFDQKKNGRLRLDDFISLCIFLQSARSDCRRNLFNSFDTAKQGRVTLDLNQFIFCSEYTNSR
ncbi:hypothetical protein Pint_34110 [Pistacia integerrima]|uniref:Uncharacterized protein n=1 Tax=Pistacia integerrima TaxID=434235 RepID=A0ACC0X5D2_9ROSI|nr:hypothetical protein Pint_34110 [Pistacia integerrima]